MSADVDAAPSTSLGPFETRFLLRRARRHADAAGQAAIDQALSNPEAIDQIGSDVLGSLADTHGVHGAIGDGTFLKLILANLPQIMQAIMAILALFPK